MSGKFEMVMLCMVSLCAGCIESRVAWNDTPSSGKKNLGGTYHLTGENAQFKEAACAAGIRMVDENETGEALDLIWKNRQTSVSDANGGGAYINNIFSFATLGIWPWISSAETRTMVSLDSPIRKANGGYVEKNVGTKVVTVGVRVWKSFLVPIAAFPCPGWGDCRGNENDIDEYMQKVIAAESVKLLTMESFLQKSKEREAVQQEWMRRKKFAVMQIRQMLNVNNH